MRTIPTGRGGAKGATGATGPTGATGAAGPAAILSSTLHTYSEAAAPPTTFTTLVYKDTTALTGGVYVWDQVSQTYKQIV